MNLSITSTDQVRSIDGRPARLWVAQVEGGTLDVYVAAIGTADDVVRNWLDAAIESGDLADRPKPKEFAGGHHSPGESKHGMANVHINEDVATGTIRATLRYADLHCEVASINTAMAQANPLIFQAWVGQVECFTQLILKDNGVTVLSCRTHKSHELN